MPPFVRRHASTAVAFTLTFIVALLVLARLAAADIDAGQLAPAVTTSDPVVASDHALDAGAPLPPSLAPHADPSVDPAATLSEFQQARRTGGLQLALGVLVAVIAGAIRARLQPTPGEPEPPPDTWRARTVALLGAAAMLAWGVADRAAGATSWIGLATIAVGAAALVWRAVNPPKGSKKPDESKA